MSFPADTRAGKRTKGKGVARCGISTPTRILYGHGRSRGLFQEVICECPAPGLGLVITSWKPGSCTRQRRPHSVKMSQPAFIKAEGFTRVIAEGAGKGEGTEASLSSFRGRTPESEGNAVMYVLLLEGCTSERYQILYQEAPPLILKPRPE